MSDSTKRETRPIYVWPEGSDLKNLKTAVIDLNLPFKVAPYWFKPGEHDKCIALDSGFPYLTDHVYPKSKLTLRASVEWFFGLRKLEHVRTTLGKLESVFGPGVQEVWDWPPSE